MPSSTLREIERNISRLSLAEQLWLLERLASDIRERAEAARRFEGIDMEEQLAAMAEDPAIQRELQAIAQEFATTEADGLDPR